MICCTRSGARRQAEAEKKEDARLAAAASGAASRTSTLNAQDAARQRLESFNAPRVPNVPHVCLPQVASSRAASQQMSISKAIVPQAQADVDDVDEEECCRICWGPATDAEPLVVPCKCKGSLRHAHANCARLWVEQCNRLKCEICGAELMHRREAVAMLTRQLAEDALLCLSLCTLAFCAANIPWLLGFYAYQLLTMREGSRMDWLPPMHITQQFWDVFVPCIMAADLVLLAADAMRLAQKRRMKPWTALFAAVHNRNTHRYITRAVKAALGHPRRRWWCVTALALLLVWYPLGLSWACAWRARGWWETTCCYMYGYQVQLTACCWAYTSLKQRRRAARG